MRLLASFLAGAATALALTIGAPGAARAADDPAFLDPAQAFAGQARLEDAAPGARTPGPLVIAFDVARGYHLYRERFAIESGGAALPAPSLPAGKAEFDPNFNKTMTLWAGAIRVVQPLPAGPVPATLTVRYQGCADRGLCYPPQQALVHLERGGDGLLKARWEAQPDALSAPIDEAPKAAATAATGSRAAPASGSSSTSATAATTSSTTAASAAPSTATATDAAPVDRSAAALQSGNLLRVLGMFLLGGLLLSFTPCVLPMLPILSSIIVGQGAPVSRSRGFTLALAYSMGMATVYTAAGIVAGLLGAGFAAALQNPWVLGAFALLLSTLALSMFGVWEFQMPGFIQERVNNASNRLKGGRHVGVFLMGGLSALLVGPCVAAPLAGALVYISQTRDVVLGGSALFALACGMSVPLLLLGLSAGTLLPRAGRWMEHVKTFFGLVLIAVALWLVSPVLPTGVLMFLIGAAALVAAICLGAFESGRPRLLKAGGALVALWSVAMIGGALSGGDSVLMPLRHLARGAGADLPMASAEAASRPATAPAFERITTLAQLDAALAATDRPVMLDFYADWCVACKEMEHLTFADPAIAARLRQARLLQADVTANSAEAKALLKRFQLFGPPGILFFDASGRELPAARTIGFLPAEEFAARLDRAAL
ncbi:protein-disulfide reductase DsbD [Mitsuaria sp. GD03876]|uniref:protein-disulfide reductase DsbD n=1 Tax=Mitsuaria sp. GD03876 TaxID=2975399 RepID=UPI0024475D91|nr:protein-disulfide reductase DsbD [Mitsuaria sp. GD03876]MDH0864001.1 protein-disulfide reductase DsbD [Mitsuaria sp. GD03876]